MLKTDSAEKIHENIYVYHNFVTEEECNSILDIVSNLSEDAWIGDERSGHKRTISIDIIAKIRERVQSLLEEGYYVGTNVNPIRMLKGSTWGVHTDEHDFLDVKEAASLYKEGEPFKLEQLNVAGMILYFNNFEGGSLFYPEKGIEYHPVKGDLVIHGAGQDCLHGVNELLSEVRYTHSNHIYKMVKVPESFVKTNLHGAEFGI